MIAIIPARGGSKGVPGKNIRPLCGKPLIVYTIESALKSKYIEKVIVTTDDEEIAEISKQAGADIPFMRPDYLAGDTSSAVDVYIHAAEFLIGSGYDMSEFMVLLPTVPLRDENDIDSAVELFREKKGTTLLSFKETEVPVSWICNVDEEGRASNANLDVSGSPMYNRQNSRKQHYIPNGAIYILNYQLLKDKRTYYCDNTIAYVMPRDRSIDIDSFLDFELAEFMINKKQSEK